MPKLKRCLNLNYTDPLFLLCMQVNLLRPGGPGRTRVRFLATDAEKPRTGRSSFASDGERLSASRSTSSVSSALLLRASCTSISLRTWTMIFPLNFTVTLQYTSSILSPTLIRYLWDYYKLFHRQAWGHSLPDCFPAWLPTDC